jgi:aminoglycoside phosphotransferase (APT) family kinase protein
VGLTGLAAAFFAEAGDPQRMQAVIDQYLRAPGGPPVEVVTCQVEFTRQDGPRSLVQYQLTLRDPVEGREWTQVVSGVAHGGHRTQRAWKLLQRLQRRDPAPLADGAVLSRAGYVPELDVLLQVFPFDHQLPALEPLMSGPLPGLLPPLLEQFGPGDWQLERWDTESVRYRVDLRACVRLTVQAREAGTGEAAERRFFAKIYRDVEQAERARGVLRELAAALDRGDEPFAIAPTVAYLPDDRVLVQGEVRGTSLSDVLGHDDAVPAVRRAARAVAALHCLDVIPPAHRGELGRTDPQRLRRTAERLRASQPDLAAAVIAVEAGILRGLATIGQLSSVPVHGDLKADHVVLDADRVVLLDLDKFAAGDPMLDVTHLLFSFGRGGTVEKRAFVEEYFGYVPAAWKPRLAPYYAWALLREASRVYKSVERHRDTSRSGRAGRNVAKRREVSESRRARQEQWGAFLLEEAHAVVAGRQPW